MAETNNSASKKGVVKFFREAKSELKKVTWPSKDQLVHNTLIILAFIIVATVILSVLDVGFAKLFQLLTSVSF